MPDKESKRVALEAGLPHFHGTDIWYRHAMNQRVLYTDGALFVAETAGAFWLLDEIALANRYQRKVVREEFQVWKLSVNGAKSTLTCEDGNDNLVWRKPIPFTDFPLDVFTFWAESDGENLVIMLPSER